MEYEFDELIRPIPDGPDWWTSIKRYPVKLIDQSFGYELQKSDMVNPAQISDVCPWQRTEDCFQKSGHSSVELNEEGFQVELCIKEFKDFEIKVCVEKGFLVIHGEHDAKYEGDGWTERSFTRRYMLPFNCEQEMPDSVLESLCSKSGGTVSVRIPKKSEKVPHNMVVELAE